MAGDLEQFAAAFFRAAGKDVATNEEFIIECSMKQKWVTPSEAERLLGMLSAASIVEIKGAYVRPKIDLSGIEVPIAYRPPKGLADPAPQKKVETMFPKLVEVAVKNGIERGTFVRECNAIQKRLDVDTGVAALIVLRDSGVDIAPYVEMVYGSIAGITPS